ncbi:unnamed protein product [Zymoseptoria tritici ST99CH_3D1]|nr:unnamed protein product [Zymoseptoria tritici ST99CH_3D1]
MARRPAVIANGARADNDAPPQSTLAAQIVHNQTRPQASSEHHGETANIRDLLQDFLHNEANVQETDVGVNAQLVKVLVQAVLERLTTGVLFENDDVLLSLASDSMAVIQATVKRQPEVLLVQLSPNEPPLLLSLLATLLALGGRPKSEDLTIRRLLETSLASLSTSVTIWQYARTLGEVIQDSVDDLISALEAMPSSKTLLNCSLPPGRSVSKLWTQAENSIAMPQGHTTSITSPTQAFVIALHVSQVSGLSSAWQQDASVRLQRVAAGIKGALEKVGLWESSVEQLIQLPRSWSLLASLLQNVADTRPSMTTQRALARAVLATLRTSSEKSRDCLLPALSALAVDDVWSSLDEDLKIATTTWLTRFVSADEMPEVVCAMRDSLLQDSAMTDSELQPVFAELSVSLPLRSRGKRPRKRRRISVEEPETRQSALLHQTTKLLTGVENADISAMPLVAHSVYATLSEEDKCAAWKCLHELAEHDLATATATVTRLIAVPELQNSKRPRILSMLAVRACVQRNDTQELTALATSEFGKHCLASLHSSIRELRMAAAESLPAFLRHDLPEEIRMSNRQVALEYLRTLSDRDIASEQETLIAAWGQVAVSCGDRELNLVLLRLVEYLGHPNPLVLGYAFSEIDAIAHAKSKTVLDLFQPFWRSIAVSVVQDLVAKPQKAQQLCELLNMDVSAFLLLTQRETLPSLVLTKKKDIIQRIANARANGSTIRDVCVQPRTNLASIITLLLVQAPVTDAEEVAFSCLVEVDPAFNNTDMNGLVKLDSVLVACEMLKHCGEEAENRKSRAYAAFQTVANINERTPGQRKMNSKRALASFLERHILGILTHFSMILEGGIGAEPTSEKTRCLKAMIEMFELTKGHLTVALPQIRACLTSALEMPETCEVAFSAWLALVPVLEAEDLVNIVDETFVIIVRHWAAVSPELQHKTYDMIANLIKKHNRLLHENILTLPSLGGITLLGKFAAEFERLKGQESVSSQFRAFARRLRVDGDTLVVQALTELVIFLEAQQGFVYDTAASGNPSPVLSELLSALLDVTVKYSNTDAKAAELCGKALGIIGCLDPNQVEAKRNKRQLLVLSNFSRPDEVVDWIMFLFEHILVKSFKSVTNTRQQGFLAFVIQELLSFCDLEGASMLRPRGSQAPDSLKRWNELPEHIRATLTPLLSSRYVMTSNSVGAPNRAYPSFSVEASHTQWLRMITHDLLFKAKGDTPKVLFPLLARTIRGHDIAIARFIFPYAVLNVVVGGTVPEVKGLTDEFLTILQTSPHGAAQQETVRSCSENVFAVLDYMSTWLTEKRKDLSETRAAAYKTGVSPNDFDEAESMGQIDTVEAFLASIPAKVIAQQAVECRSYSRALFHWEQHIRAKRSLIPGPRLSEEGTDLYSKLQDIYSQIDEPDGLEGIAAHLTIVSDEQQAINHAKAGRWTAAQAWYELQLTESPGDTYLQHDVLNCLRETGQYAPLLRYANGFLDAAQDEPPDEATSQISILPLAAEASWMTDNLTGLESRLKLFQPDPTHDFNVGIARILLYAEKGSEEHFVKELTSLRKAVTDGLSMAGTDSLQACHDEIMKLHVLHELEVLMRVDQEQVSQLLNILDKRLAVIGSYIQDKQYVLGIRRATIRVRADNPFTMPQYGSLWLTTARLARQTKNTSSAYNAVLKALECGEQGSKLEEARLLWHEGHQRQAIQALDAAIISGVFESGDEDIGSLPVTDPTAGQKQNMLAGKASLLLAKWLDASGQSQTKDMTDRYRTAAQRYQRWEKGHYYLGKHYSKLLDAQKALPKEKRSQAFLTGEMTKLVIDNSLRSIPFGNKYWHETIPRILTLWLELGQDSVKKDPREDQAIFERRSKALAMCNKQLQKYFERVPPYVFYHALPQLISRITHPHPEVWKQLRNILARIAAAHPSQALWSMLPVVKATDKMRVERGTEVLNILRDPKSKLKSDTTGIDLRTMIQQGQRLTDGLLLAAEHPIEGRSSHVSLTKDLKFNMKLAPSNLVVPVEATLMASAPATATSETIRRHKAFTSDKVTIQSFTDDVLVLQSLQRPKKINMRGSDGKLYGILCKPKDDLRKDQRLMEFNGIINRALKRNTESAKRRLYIKTYAVTPLSEESGTLEWVEGIKPMRDILLNIYSRKGIRPNYTDIKKTLDDASSAPENADLFRTKVLSLFPASLHEWFTETYPEPEIWFNARLRYARTAAVMSMVGHVLGLGDRHGENILLEEGTGGVFHVDFNCLFDKGLTFEKPEMVPFRLTHNMVDAMGPYGYEGPFRKSSELTLGLLRQEKDTLMTVLETFLYDPTTDFVNTKKKRSTTPGVPETPTEILESVATKLKGLLRGETVPLSVEGYVDALVQEATSDFRLASMYIGWCSFL